MLDGEFRFFFEEKDSGVSNYSKKVINNVTVCSQNCTLELTSNKAKVSFRFSEKLTLDDEGNLCEINTEINRQGDHFSSHFTRCNNVIVSENGKVVAEIPDGAVFSHWMLVVDCLEDGEIRDYVSIDSESGMLYEYQANRHGNTVEVSKLNSASREMFLFENGRLGAVIELPHRGLVYRSIREDLLNTEFCERVKMACAEVGSLSLAYDLDFHNFTLAKSLTILLSVKPSFLEFISTLSQVSDVAVVMQTHDTVRLRIQTRDYCDSNPVGSPIEHIGSDGRFIFPESESVEMFLKRLCTIKTTAVQSIGRCLEQAVHDHIAKKGQTGFLSSTRLLEDETPSGDCGAHAVLLATLLRAKKIPARIVYGVICILGEMTCHAWVEAWEGEKWIRFDGTNPGSDGAIYLKLLNLGEMNPGTFNSETSRVLGIVLESQLIEVVAVTATGQVFKSGSVSLIEDAGSIFCPWWQVKISQSENWKASLGEGMAFPIKICHVTSGSTVPLSFRSYPPGKSKLMLSRFRETLSQLNEHSGDGISAFFHEQAGLFFLNESTLLTIPSIPSASREDLLALIKLIDFLPAG